MPVVADQIVQGRLCVRGFSFLLETLLLWFYSQSSYSMKDNSICCVRDNVVAVENVPAEFHSLVQSLRVFEVLLPLQLQSAVQT